MPEAAPTEPVKQAGSALGPIGAACVRAGIVKSGGDRGQVIPRFCMCRRYRSMLDTYANRPLTGRARNLLGAGCAGDRLSLGRCRRGRAFLRPAAPGRNRNPGAGTADLLGT